MGILADLTALTMQMSARTSVRYGKDLYFSGTDLADPERVRIPTRHGDVRCDLYCPMGTTPPIYTHFHGGGFLMRYPAMDDFFARFLVAETGTAVINVDYDVAPQHRYPVAQEQAHDVVAWLTGHAGEWGLDGNRVAVGGFSAGGNLAASACLQARDNRSARPVLQLLGVPSLDVASGVHSKPSTIANPMVGPGLLNLVRKAYFKDVSRRSEPYASPLLADDLFGLPPAVIVTAEYDALRAEGDAYAIRLKQSGVDVVHRMVPKHDHYFLDGDRVQARGVLDLFATALSSAYSTV